MSDDTEGLDLATLADQAGVNQRTVRYYVTLGLLPAPTRGANARYPAQAVDRLRLIKEYRDQHLPLSEIRARLEALDDEGVAAALGKPLELPLSDTALGYVRKVLGVGKQKATSPPAAAPADVMAMMRSRSTRTVNEPDDTLFGAARVARMGRVSESGEAAPPQWEIRKSTWERIRLSRDVELNVRRPLSRDDNRKIERLLDAAREIFEEEP